MRQFLGSLVVLISLIGINGCEGTAGPTITSQNASSQTMAANTISSSSGNSNIMDVPSDPSSVVDPHISSSQPPSSFYPSSSQFVSDPPDEEEEISEISVCVFYTREGVKSDIDSDECTCHHCDGELKIKLTGVDEFNFWDMSNKTCKRRYLITGGERNRCDGAHSANDSQSDGHYNVDIPGSKFSGGSFINGKFTFRPVEFIPSSDTSCYKSYSSSNKCYQENKDYRAKSVLYSVIGRVNGKYFTRSPKKITIGSTATINRDEIELSKNPSHFGDWCEILSGVEQPLHN